jgi:hypothetical protein
MIIMHERAEQISWSLIAPTPQCFYHMPSRSHIVYWQGVGMTRNQAMMIVQSAWIQAYPTPAMKRAEFANFKRAYLLGAFGNTPWRVEHYTADTHLGNLYNWIKKQNPNLFQTLSRQYSIKEAMGWFLDETVLNG